ncbi:MAG: hypothetical protein IPO50_11910 [Sphingomonadales bacterium]|nr:hypothetical protein [Sphingomonadales bacterium]
MPSRRRANGARRDFLVSTDGFMTVDERHCLAEAEAAFLSTLKGGAAPDQGIVVAFERRPPEHQCGVSAEVRVPAGLSFIASSNAKRHSGIPPAIIQSASMKGASQ